MKILYLNIFLYIFFFNNIIFAQSINVVNIQYLIDNNLQYVEVIKDIELSQQKYLKQFKITEDKLKQTLENIEESKLILSDLEINNRIEQYNNQLSIFTVNVEEFNNHYQNQIFNVREIILKEIIILLEKFAINNSVDLILDSTSYLIASNSIDITENLDKELKKININLVYSDFKNN